MALSDPVTRINALTINARNTWFALLGILLFISITLVSVEHIDFYAAERDTRLPIVNVDVPTRFFFVAGAFLALAVYGYFHLYLIRLWDALGAAPERIDGQPLGDVVAPWLMTDAALHFRNWQRQDGCVSPRVLEGPAMLLNFILSWVFGLAVLGALWWYSMPARSLNITAPAAIAMIIACFVALRSGFAIWTRLSSAQHRARMAFPFHTPFLGLLLILVPIVCGITYLRTSGTPQTLAFVNLEGQEIIKRPRNWLPYQIARASSGDELCVKIHGKDCNPVDVKEVRLKEPVWKAQRSALVAFGPKSWQFKPGQSKPDLRAANIRNAFLPYVNLENARLQRADFRHSTLEGSNLSHAELHGANFDDASLPHVWFHDAEMNFATTFVKAKLDFAEFLDADMPSVNLSQSTAQSPDFTDATLTGANFALAKYSGPDFTKAKLRDAKFTNAEFKDAIFIGAELEDADFVDFVSPIVDFSKADLLRADFSDANISEGLFPYANLRHAKFSNADISNGDLSFAFLEGNAFIPALFINQFNEADFSGVNLSGTALRNVDLSRITFDEETDLSNAFLDGSVVLPQGLQDISNRPCQWVDTVLDDAEFYGYWRAWISATPDQAIDFETTWAALAPEDFANAPPILPAPACLWKSDPQARN